jgi:phosphoribosyl 1,2-cyclic phosphodiesterase
LPSISAWVSVCIDLDRSCFAASRLAAGDLERTGTWRWHGRCTSTAHQEVFMADVHIRFHGVRGSMATPGTDTAAVGGNTSCVEITDGDTRLILDAGTGLKALGDRLLAGGAVDATILLSHLHWDHIQGLPFFAPLYAPSSAIEVLSGPNGVMPLAEALRQQMRAPFFPVPWGTLPSRVRARDLASGERFTVGGAEVTVSRLNHPDPVFGYRVELGGRAVVYATDTEHFSCVDPGLKQLAAGADVLIYDAQYTPEEYRGAAGPARVGWGHSTFAAAAELARAAGVGQLILFHHDPSRSDDGVAELERRARDLFAETVAAREGMSIVAGERAASGSREAA